jgi:hypothetical protein
VREIEPPPAAAWDFYACFVGEHVVAKTIPDEDDETLVVIDSRDAITTLARSEHPIIPGPPRLRYGVRRPDAAARTPTPTRTPAAVIARAT